MRRRASLRWLLLGLIAVLPLTAACGGAVEAGESPTLLFSDPAERPDAPELAGEDLESETVDSASFAGQVVVVNFWASWCAPCRREGPELIKAAEDTAPLGVSFLGVNIRDDRDQAKAFEAGLGVEYPSIFDPSGRLALQFPDVPPNTIPATIIIDREGRIAAVFRQELTADTLIEAITDIAEEKA